MKYRRKICASYISAIFSGLSCKDCITSGFFPTYWVAAVLFFFPIFTNILCQFAFNFLWTVSVHALACLHSILIVSLIRLHIICNSFYPFKSYIFLFRCSRYGHAFSHVSNIHIALLNPLIQPCLSRFTFVNNMM